MSTRPVAGMNAQVTPNEKILRISATDISGGLGNDRLSAQDGKVVLRSYERVVLATVATASGNISIELPDPLQCIGEIITIIAVSVSNSKTITPKDAAGNAVGNALTASNDIVCLLAVGATANATVAPAGWYHLIDVTT